MLLSYKIEWRGSELMELWQEILVKELKREAEENGLPLDVHLKDLLDSVCYKALRGIKQIIENDELDDASCFMRIEEIVCALEDIGSDGGFRHDF